MGRHTGLMDPDQINAISDRGWAVILILGIVAAIVAFATAWAILKSADKPAPTLLVMSLSMLTLLSVVAFVVTSSQEMATLAGVGLGALAAAVSSMFGRIQNIAATAENMDPLPSPLESIPNTPPTIPPPRSPDEGL